MRDDIIASFFYRLVYRTEVRCVRKAESRWTVVVISLLEATLNSGLWTLFYFLTGYIALYAVRMPNNSQEARRSSGIEEASGCGVVWKEGDAPCLPHSTILRPQRWLVTGRDAHCGHGVALGRRRRKTLLEANGACKVPSLLPREQGHAGPADQHRLKTGAERKHTSGSASATRQDLPPPKQAPKDSPG